MGWYIYLLISVVGGTLLGVAGTASTHYWALVLWRTRRKVQGYRWIDGGLDEKTGEWNFGHREYGWYLADKYDDSSYARRDAPHSVDYWHGFLLTLVSIASYPVWGITLWCRRSKAKRVKAWKINKEHRAARAEVERQTETEHKKIINELTKGEA